jgi:hypothetical protein
MLRVLFVGLVELDALTAHTKVDRRDARRRGRRSRRRAIAYEALKRQHI